MSTRATQGFSGFPEGKLRLTPIPSLFYSELLPSIDHLGELKVTLYAFWALARKPGRLQYLRQREIAQDELFMDGLREPAIPPDEALAEALERAVARGTLIKATPEGEDGEEAYFFLNSAKGRAAIKAIQDGQWRPSGDPDSPLELIIERPNIFRLYEQNIGPLTPMIAETLRDAEATYPGAWIEEALQIAVENNVRKWRYVQAILDDWTSKGRDDREYRGDTQKARRRYLQGEFSDFIDE